MVTYFEIVLKVLDRAYKEIDEDDKDQKILACLEALSTTYADALNKGGPSYKDPITRFAYVFRYTTAHAEYLNQAMGWCDELRAALDGEVSITCIGGGPGSDVLGFVKFLLAAHKLPDVTYHIIDSEPLWMETWSGLDAIIAKSLTTSRNYFPVDVTKKESYGAYRTIFNADIFTLIYFLSEVYKSKDKVTRFLEHCFKKMKKGALFVVIDFRSYDLQIWIDNCAQNNGMEKLAGFEDRAVVGLGEQKNAIKKYIDKFGPPKLEARIMFRVFRKK